MWLTSQPTSHWLLRHMAMWLRGKHIVFIGSSVARYHQRRVQLADPAPLPTSTSAVSRVACHGSTVTGPIHASPSSTR